MFYKIYNLIYILIIVNQITLKVNKTILCAISFITKIKHPALPKLYFGVCLGGSKWCSLCSSSSKILLKSELHKSKARVSSSWMNVQYCAKVMQAKCANFVLCSRDFLTIIREKVRMKFHGISSDNSLEQRTVFLRSFVQPKKIREHKR